MESSELLFFQRDQTGQVAFDATQFLLKLRYLCQACLQFLQAGLVLEQQKACVSELLAQARVTCPCDQPVIFLIGALALLATLVVLAFSLLQLGLCRIQGPLQNVDLLLKARDVVLGLFKQGDLLLRGIQGVTLLLLIPAQFSQLFKIGVDGAQLL